MAVSLSSLFAFYYYRLLCNNCNTVSKLFTSICPGADAFFAAPNVKAEPNTSPQSLLITPVPAIDIVIIGLSAYSDDVSSLQPTIQAHLFCCLALPQFSEYLLPAPAFCEVLKQSPLLQVSCQNHGLKQLLLHLLYVLSSMISFTISSPVNASTSTRST